MKRLLSCLLIAVLLLAAVPASAGLKANQARTTLLDLSSATSNSSNAQEGWSFEIRGYNNNPQLTLNSYGSASQHSAPIIVPKNTRIVVNGDCYIDNVYMGADHDTLSGSPDGYLIIDGTGTLNLYAESYHGCCLTLPNGGENVDAEYLYINNVTVNCFGMDRDMYNISLKLQPCIYSNHNIEIHNATVNTNLGKYGLRADGFTPIGGTTEDNCNQILIDNSTVNIRIVSDAGYYNYAYGIWITYGKIRITGDSNVTINAGSKSIYCKHSFTVDGGNVRIFSTPHASTDVYALITCKCLRLLPGLESFYAGVTKIKLASILACSETGTSVLGEGLEVKLGSFSEGDYTAGTDPENNDLPALYVTAENTLKHTVRFYGFGDELIATVLVSDGEAAQAPTVPQTVTDQSGLHRFRCWDAAFDCITEDTDIHAVYGLVGDVDCNGVVDMADVTALNAYLVNCGSVTEEGIFNADVNGGGADAYDSTLIAMIALGIPLPN